MLRAFWRAPSGLLGVAAIGVIVLVAIIAPPVLTSHANVLDIGNASKNPTWGHLLGTDTLGRDIFERLLVAGRTSVLLGLAATALGAVIGFTLGGVAALLPPRLRTVALRIVDTCIAFPVILVGIFMTAVVGVGATGAAVGIGIALAFSFARLASTLALSIGNREYVAAGRVLGVRGPRLFLRYVLPNMAETLLLALTVAISSSIVWISALSFLGLGVQPPRFDWGLMLTQGVQSFYVTPAAALGPAGAIAFTALAFGFAGEALARAMNPVLWTQSVSRMGSTATASEFEPSAIEPGLIDPAHVERPQIKEEPADAAANELRPVELGASGRRPQAQRAQSDEAPAASSVVELHGRNGNGVSSTPTTGTVLDARNLTVTFPGPNGPMKVVDGVSLSVRRGETVGIVGESGSGKTMTAMAIARLVSFPGVVSGSVVFNGKALEAMRNAQLNRLLGSSLAVIFQDPTASLNPVLKLGIQLTEGVERHRGLKRAAARALAVSRLGEVAIPMPARQLKRYPHELSGGMRQRTTIAMGLMNEPALILADEPTTALDVTVQAQIMDLLYQVKQSHDVALILISHNIALVSQNCDRILVMYAGRIVEAANTEDILQRPLHPYTRGLLASVPDIARERSIPLEEIAGQAPNMAALPTGCPYRTRCPLAVSKCARERPPLVSHEDGRREVACWVASEDIG